MTLFIIAYLAVLCMYFVTETSGKMILRAPNKILLASMFLTFAIVQFQHYEFLSYHLLLMAALFLAWMGDVFLLIDLNRGGDFFLGGNVCFILYEMAVAIDNGFSFADFAWVIPALFVIMLAFVYCAQKFPKVLKLGKMKWPMVLYLTSISFHGLMGIALMTLLPGTPFFVLGLGSLLFWISDMIITVLHFVIIGNKWILRANSAFYFTGLLLIVLSMAM